ncbi:PKD domain-containing protein [Streptomyces cavourensis]
MKATFTDQSTDADGTIASRSWNFGDGTTSTATNPSKTYSPPRTYTVKLTVTDDKQPRPLPQGPSPSCAEAPAPSAPVPMPGAGPELPAQQPAATTGNYAYLYLYVPVGTTQLRSPAPAVRATRPVLSRNGRAGHHQLHSVPRSQQQPHPDHHQPAGRCNHIASTPGMKPVWRTVTTSYDTHHGEPQVHQYSGRPPVPGSSPPGRDTPPPPTLTAGTPSRQILSPER